MNDFRSGMKQFAGMLTQGTPMIRTIGRTARLKEFCRANTCTLIAHSKSTNEIDVQERLHVFMFCLTGSPQQKTKELNTPSC